MFYAGFIYVFDGIVSMLEIRLSGVRIWNLLYNFLLECIAG